MRRKCDHTVYVAEKPGEFVRKIKSSENNVQKYVTFISEL